MYPTNNAESVNTVSSGEGVPCPNCHVVNKSTSRFCITCGTQLIANEDVAQNFVPAFSQIDETEKNEVLNTTIEPEVVNEIEETEIFSESKETEVFSEIKKPEVFNEIKEPEVVPEVKIPNIQQPKVKYVEPESVFAQGLPSWSIEPPQVMVRRR